MAQLEEISEISPMSVAEDMIGKHFYEVESDVRVDMNSVRSICAASENANPLFWNDKFAQEVVGACIAPPSSVAAWLRPHFWSPSPNADARALKLHFDLKEVFQVPEGIMVDNELTLYAPVKVGEQLRTYQVLRSVSEEKRVKLGIGRFWVIDVVIENESGERCAVDRYTGLGYRKDSDGE